MSNVRAAANSEIAFALASQISSVTNYFDPAGTAFSGTVVPAADDMTITFEITVKLQRALKL